MESAFAWIGQIFSALLQLFPRIRIIRATHGGIKWVRGKHVYPLGPGLHVWWPLTTDIEVIVTARQTLAIPDQVMVTKDGRRVAVKTLVVYRISDIVRAIGRVNWDVDTTINDLAQSAVARVISTHTHDQILSGIQDDTLTEALTQETRHELRQFGVYITRCKLVDFAECKVFKIITTQADRQGLPTH